MSKWNYETPTTELNETLKTAPEPERAAVEYELQLRGEIDVD